LQKQRIRHIDLYRVTSRIESLPDGLLAMKAEEESRSPDGSARRLRFDDPLIGSEVTEVAKALHDTPAADSFYEDSGYESELKRTLGSFQIFAISFAFISVAVGIFSTYDDVLKNAGPVGIWL
jgi:amino acid permease